MSGAFSGRCSGKTSRPVGRTPSASTQPIRAGSAFLHVVILVSPANVNRHPTETHQSNDGRYRQHQCPASVDSIVGVEDSLLVSDLEHAHTIMPNGELRLTCLHPDQLFDRAPARLSPLTGHLRARGSPKDRLLNHWPRVLHPHCRALCRKCFKWRSVRPKSGPHQQSRQGKSENRHTFFHRPRYRNCLRKNALCRAMCANCAGAIEPPRSSSSVLSTWLA